MKLQGFFYSDTSDSYTLFHAKCQTCINNNFPVGLFKHHFLNEENDCGMQIVAGAKGMLEDLHGSFEAS